MALLKSSSVAFVMFTLLLSMSSQTEAAPIIFHIFGISLRPSRHRDRGANSFAGGAGCRIGGNTINPDPFTFNPIYGNMFPSVPLCI